MIVRLKNLTAASSGVPADVVIFSGNSLPKQKQEWIEPKLAEVLCPIVIRIIYSHCKL